MHTTSLKYSQHTENHMTCYRINYTEMTCYNSFCHLLSVWIKVQMSRSVMGDSYSTASVWATITSSLFVCSWSLSSGLDLNRSVHLLFRKAACWLGGVDEEAETRALKDSLLKSASFSVLKILKSNNSAKILPSLLQALSTPGCSNAWRKS